MKRRRIIITEVEDAHGMARLTFEQEGDMTVEDLSRMLANAQFGVGKQLERQLSDVARGVIVGAGLEPSLDQNSPLQAHGSPCDVLPPAVRKRLGHQRG